MRIKGDDICKVLRTVPATHKWPINMTTMLRTVSRYWGGSCRDWIEHCKQRKEKTTSENHRRHVDFQLIALKYENIWVLVVKNPPVNAGDIRDVGSIPRLGRFPGGRHGNCLENPHGQRSLAGYSPWGCKDSDLTEQLGTAQHSMFNLR